MDLKKLLNIAETAHRNGDLELARKKYLKIIENFENNDAVYGLATLYFHQKKFSSAIPLFEKAILREPFASDIALNYAYCLQASKQNEKAIAVINSIKSLLPNDHQTILSFAHLSLKLKKPEIAIEILKRFNLQDMQSMSLLASSFIELKNWLEAKIIWHKLTLLSPATPLFWQKLALCAAKLREYTQAIQAFTAFISLAQKDSANHLKFADLCILSRDINKAREQLKIAIDLGDCTLTRFELEARICRLENNIEQAVFAANKVVELDPTSHTAWSIKQELGHQYSDCISKLNFLYENEIKNTYENQHNLFTLAKAHEKQENYKMAFNCFSKANTLQLEQQKDSDLVYDEIKVNDEFNFYKKVSASPKKHSIDKPENIFIVGMPRSGTTLMDRLMSQHPEVKSCGENEALASTIDPKITPYKAMEDVNWNDFFDKNAQSFAQSYKKDTPINANIIVDKMPHNFRYVGAIISIFKNVKIIQMRRSPEDLALSIFSHPFALHHNYAAKLSSIAHTIYNANKLMDFWVQKYPENVIDVNYEQLTKTPSATMDDIYRFCNLTWHEEYLNFHQKNVSSFTFSELQVRQPVNTSKINFSRHYKNQFTEFREIYNSLIQSNC